jgi:hypothetical protein
MKNRKTLIKLKKFILKIKNPSNIELLEEYRKSNSHLDYIYEIGFSNENEYDRNSILKEHILNRMRSNN